MARTHKKLYKPKSQKSIKKTIKRISENSKIINGLLK